MVLVTLGCKLHCVTLYYLLRSLCPRHESADEEMYLIDESLPYLRPSHRIDRHRQDHRIDPTATGRRTRSTRAAPDRARTGAVHRPGVARCWTRTGGLQLQVGHKTKM
jgi:hypothetical protein